MSKKEKGSPEKSKVAPVVTKEMEAKQAQEKQERQKEQAKERVKVLQTSGILDAYEYLLRQVCKNGLPDTNIFQFAAQQILKYQKKMKINNQKKEQLLGFSRVEGNIKERGSADKRVALIREEKSKERTHK